jgi:hypothetical protein
MRLASPPALDVEAVGFDSVPIHEVLGVEGQRREWLGAEVGGRQDGEAYRRDVFSDALAPFDINGQTDGFLQVMP